MSEGTGSETPKDNERVVVIGAEMAAAQDAEALHRSTHDLPSPMAAIPSYNSAELDLFRFKESPTDRPLRRFIEGCRSLGPDAIRVARDSLTMQDEYKLHDFARRSFLLSLRAHDPGPAFIALDGVALMDRGRMDWRDTSVATAMLSCAIDRTGGDRAEAFRKAAGLASPAMASYLEEFLHPPTDDLVAAVGLRECDSPDGVVLTHDSFKPYHPTVDLIGIARAVIHLIEEDGWLTRTVSTGSDLPVVWCKRGERGEIEKALQGVTGGILIHGEPAPRTGDMPRLHQMLLAFVGEMESEEAAATIARTVGSDGGAHGFASIAINVGRLCAALIQRSLWEGEEGVETDTALKRYSAALASILQQPLSSS